MRLLRALCCTACVVAAASSAGAADLTVFAAASLSGALEEIAALHSSHSGRSVRCNFGGSGTLARQLLEGAPADVVFFADEQRIDQLDKAGLLAPGTKRTLLSNTLVLVVAADRGAVNTLDDLGKAQVRRIAVGEPSSVPAGTYARDYLQRSGHWPKLAGKMVALDSVRAVLAAVESGNADAGFVYETDVRTARGVRIAMEVPAGGGPQIVYPAAVLKGAKDVEAAAALIAFLEGKEAKKIFLKHGFHVLH